MTFSVHELAQKIEDEYWKAPAQIAPTTPVELSARLTFFFV